MSGKCPHCKTYGSILKGVCRFCHREVNPPVKHMPWNDSQTVCGKRLLDVFAVLSFAEVTCKRCGTDAYLKRVEKEDAAAEQRDINETFKRLQEGKEIP